MHLVEGKGKWFVNLFMLVNPTPKKRKKSLCGEGVFNLNSHEYYHFRSYICLNYEKEEKVELETMGIRAPIL